MSELNKRILTSLILLTILFMAIKNYFVLSLLLIFCFYEMFFEFYNILKKIFIKKKNTLYFLLIFLLFYLFLICFCVWLYLTTNNKFFYTYFLFILSICIMSDIGGYIFGKIFKGKKITKVSPKKTYSGMFGSFCLSIVSTSILFNNFMDYEIIFLLSFVISLMSQIGDLLISFLKRKAKIKDSGMLLPGHGGLLDRFDGLLLGLPMGTLFYYLI